MWKAREQLDRLIREDPASRLRLQGLYATACVGLGEHERAITLYRELVSGIPADADVHLSIAHAQKTLGRREESIASYRRAAQSRADFGDAYWSLANLKTYRFTPEEFARLRALTSDPAVAAVDRVHALFALAKALEDAGDYAQSFRYYAEGNALKRAESRYAPQIIENNTRAQIEVCTREFFAERSGWGVARAVTRFSSLACRVPAPPCLNKSWLPIRRSRARRSCPTCSRSSPRCAAGIRIRAIRATRGSLLN